MRGARELIGIPVMDLRAGKRIGTVRDILVDRAWRIRGIVLDYKSWFSYARYVEWKDIRAFGADALMIECKACIKKYKDMPGFYYMLYGKSRLRGLPLISTEGIQMGHLEDVYFSPKMEDSIIGFELSEGLITDLHEGRRKLPLPEGVERGEDCIKVPVMQAGELEFERISY